MKKVVVGLSGGVDSAVTALLLTQNGLYNVEAVFMQNWDTAQNLEYNINEEDDRCEQKKDYADAKEVAKQLNIKLHYVNFVDEYYEKVFKVFINDLEKGLTPNPDILCNSKVKFDSFLKYAIEELGADYIATGHYARLEEGKLLKGVDDNKDQTYFLAEINKEVFDKIIFPIGEMKKEEVKKLAKEYKLFVADKKESMGICFVGKRNFNEFISNYIKEKKGNVIDISTGENVGEHKGLFNHTIGQKKGLGKISVTSKDNDAGYIVVKKNLEDNILYVAQGDDNEYLFSNQITINNFNKMVDYDIEKIENLRIRFRYRQKDHEISNVLVRGNTLVIDYPSYKAVTLGQEAVIYHNDICLGGGQITSLK